MSDSIDRLLAIRAAAFARHDLNLVAEVNLSLGRLGYVESVVPAEPLERAVPRKPRQAT